MRPTRTLTHKGPPHGAGSSTPFLFLAFHCDRPLAPTVRHSLAGLDHVAIGRGDVTAWSRDRSSGERGLAITLDDQWVSSQHAQLNGLAEGWVLVDAGSKNGTRVNGEPCQRKVLSDGDLLEIGHTLFVFRSGLAPSPGSPPDQSSTEPTLAEEGTATLVPALAEAFARLPAMARTDVPVVVRGETGTGKELIARALHRLSGRSGAFMAVNCGAFAPDLISAELFGSRRGAYSGASDDRPGLIRAAHRGTLFLDEIGDLPMSLQAPFLRVLQQREVLPVGDTRAVPVDFKLVCATHKDLEMAAANGTFRPDLYGRLSGLTVELPPLSARREDLGLLAAALLTRLAPERAERITFSTEAARLLFTYGWPLNIRELERSLASALVLCEGRPIEVADLPRALRVAPIHPPPPVAAEPEPERPAAPLSPADERRKAELVALLETHRGNIAAVARELSKARVQIQRWMSRYGLTPDRFRD